MSLGRNILWNIAAFLWLSLLVIFVTPYMVHKLGLEAFGLWSVITAFGGYLGAMDLGLGNALIRFVAAENERGDRRAMERYLRSGISLQIALGFLVSLLLFIGSRSIAHQWIRVSPELLDAAVFSFRLFAPSILLGFLVVTYGAVMAALHRFDLLALRTVLLMSVQYLSVVGVLHAGGGLREVIAVYVLGSAAVVVYLIVVARKLLPGVNLWPGWHSDSVAELLRFGRMKFPAQLSSTLLQQFDRVALGVFLPVGMVGFYAVPLRVSQRLGQVAENVAAPFYPAIASHLVADREEALRRQYRQGSRVVAAIVGGAIAVVWGLAVPILSVWMGDEFARNGAWPFRLLLLAYGASALFTLPSVAADAAGRPGIPASFLVAGAVGHVLLIWFAVPHWGLLGASAGVLCGFLFPLLFGVPVIHRRVHALPRFAGVFLDVRGILIAAGVTLIISWAGGVLLHARTGVLPLLITLVASSSIYVALLFLFRVFGVEDLARLLRTVRPSTEGVEA